MEPFAAGALLVSSLISTGVSIKSNIDQKHAAKRSAALQRQQAAIQERLAIVRKNREARKLRAIQAASGAAQGGFSSAISGAIGGIEAQRKEQVDLTQSQTQLQLSQIDLAADNAASQANANIGAAFGNFAATALTPDAKGKTLVERAFKK